MRTRTAPILDRWLRDIDRQMWVNHHRRQAVSFSAAIEMKMGDAESFKIGGTLGGPEGQLAEKWYERHYPREVIIDALLDAKLDARGRVRQS